MSEKPIDHEYTSEVVCPWCGNEYRDSWEFADETETECEECEKPFSISRDVTITYTTRIPYTGEPEHPDGYDGPCGCDTCLEVEVEE